MVQRITDNTVEQQRFTGARLQAADFGEGRAIAAGAQNLAQGLDTATQNLAKIGEMKDEAEVKRADAEDLKQIIQIKTEALSATGLDAPKAVEDATKRISEIKKARMSQLGNSRQRQLYSDVFDARDLQMQEAFIGHSVKQIKEAEKTAAVERSAAYSDLAVDTYGTDAFENNMQTSLNEVAVVNKGMPEAVITRRQAEEKSKVYARVISGMLTNPDNVQEAQHAIEQHAKDLLPEEETALRKAINPILEEDQTEVDAGRAFSSSPVPEAQADGETPDPLAPAPDIQNPKRPPVVSPADPLRGKGRVTNSAAQHRARGSGNALDIAAPEGTPIRPPMSGKVIKNWWSKEGGWSVLVEHPNGYVTGYAHMRAQSPLSEGSPVEADTVIGGVGSTGEKSTGPHVHYTVRQSRAGPKVDPNALNWGDTVNPKSVNWKEPALPQYNAEENQLGRALDRLHKIATVENWGSRRYERAVTAVRQKAGIQDQLYQQQKETLYKDALETVVKLDDKLTSVSQIPNFADLDPVHKRTIQGIIDSNKSGANNPDAASADYFRYFSMAMNPATRAQFAKEDLLKNPNLTNGERKQLFGMQWGIANDTTGSLTGKMDEASTFANRYLPVKDFPDPQTRQRFMDTYMERVTAAQTKGGRQLNDREKDDIARGLVVPIVRYQRTPEGGEKKIGKGFFFDYGGPLKGERATVDFEQVYSTIPSETQSRIVNTLKSQGKSHTKQDIVRVYLEQAR